MPNAGPYLTPRRIQTGSWTTTTDTTAPSHATIANAPTEGSIVLVFVNAWDSADAALPVLTATSGWTELTSAGRDEGAFANMTDRVFYRITLPGHTTTIAPCTSDIDCDWNWVIYEFENIDPDNPIGAVATAIDQTGASSMDLTFTSATEQDIGVLVVNSSVDNSAHAFTIESPLNAWDTWANSNNVDNLLHYAYVNYSEAFDITVSWTLSRRSSGAMVFLRARRQYGFETPKIVQSNLAQSGSSSNSIQIALGQDPTLGNTLIAIYQFSLALTEDDLPDGWTLYKNYAVGDSPSAADVLVATKTVEAADIPAATYTFTSTTSTHHAVWLAEINTAIDEDNLFDIDAETRTSGSTVTSLAGTTSTAGEQDVELVINFLATNNSTTGLGLTGGSEGGFTEDQTNSGLGVATLVSASKGTYGTTWSWTTARHATNVFLGIRAARQPYKQPVRVQSKTGTAGDDAASANATFDDTPLSGNIGVAWIAARDGANAAVPTITLPTGWTQQATQDLNGTNASITVATKVLDGTETSALTFTPSVAGSIAVLIEEYANVNSADIVDQTKAAEASATSLALTLDAKTSQSAGMLVAGFATFGAQTSEAYTNGFTQVAVAAAGSSEVVDLAVADRLHPYGDAWTVTGSGSSSLNYGGILVALNAAPMTGYCTPVRVQENGATADSTSVGVTVTAPTSGNLILNYFISRGTGQTLTPPSGFTAISGVAKTIGSTAQVAASYKISDGSEGTTITSTSDSSSKKVALVFEYTGVDTSNPIGEVVADTNGAATAAAVALTHNTEQFTSMIVALMGFDDVTSAWAYDQGFAEVESLASSATSAVSASGADWLMTSNATPATAPTWTTSASSAEAMIMLRPASSPIVRWQEATEIDSGSTSVQATLPQTPTPGNWLVAIGSAKDTGVEPNFSLPSGWTELDESVLVASTKTSYVIAKKVEAGDAALLSITIAAATDAGGLTLIEYEGIFGEALVDVDVEAGVSASSQAFDPGVTTTNGPGLVLAMVPPSSDITAVTASSTAGFQVIGEETVSAKYSMIALERIICTGGTYQPTVSWTTARVAGGVIFAFDSDVVSMVGIGIEFTASMDWAFDEDGSTIPFRRR